MSLITEPKIKTIKKGTLQAKTAKEGPGLKCSYYRFVIETPLPILDEEVIEVRDIPIGQIKKEMLSLLSDGNTRYVDEIAEKLNLDFMDVMEAFNQLKEEDKLFIDENKL